MSNQITAVQFLNMVAVAKNVTALEYNPEWENGTGYFDGLSREPLEHGKIYTSRDQHGRIIIAMATNQGNAVAFQRYGDNHNVVTWCGDSTLLRALGGTAGISTDELCTITGYQISHTGDKLYNLGGRFSAICELMAPEPIEE